MQIDLIKTVFTRILYLDVFLGKLEDGLTVSLENETKLLISAQRGRKLLHLPPLTDKLLIFDEYFQPSIF